MLEQGLKRYFSEAQLARLTSVTVGVAGAGGLGSNCAMLLARSGVRRMVLADFDVVEPSNLNRQFYFPADVGKPKVEALAENLARINPNLSLTLAHERLDADGVAEIFKDCPIVVEALDKAEYKAILCNRLMQTSAFVVGASGIGGAGGPPMQKRRLGRFICVGDFSTECDITTPPLAPRVMQAAALQADSVLELILSGVVTPGE